MQPWTQTWLPVTSCAITGLPLLLSEPWFTPLHTKGWMTVYRGPSSWKSGALKSTVPAGARGRGHGAGSADPPSLHGCLKQAQAQTVRVLGRGSPRVQELVSAIMGAVQTHSNWSQGLRQAGSMPDGGRAHLGPGDFSSASNDFPNQLFPPSPSLPTNP